MTDEQGIVWVKCGQCGKDIVKGNGGWRLRLVESGTLEELRKCSANGKKHQP